MPESNGCNPRTHPEEGERISSTASLMRKCLKERIMVKARSSYFENILEECGGFRLDSAVPWSQKACDCSPVLMLLQSLTVVENVALPIRIGTRILMVGTGSREGTIIAEGTAEAVLESRNPKDRRSDLPRCEQYHQEIDALAKLENLADRCRAVRA